MVQLPDISLETRPTPRPSKGIAHIQPTTGFANIPAQVQAQVAADVQRLGQQIFQAKERHDTLVAEDANNQFRAGMIELESGEAGFGNVHGAKAFSPGFREDYGNRLTQLREELGKDLNSNQASMFERRATIGTLGFDERLIRHSANEDMAFANKTADASADLALLNVEAHGGEYFKVDIETALRNIKLAGDQNGLPPDATAVKQQQFVDAMWGKLVGVALDDGLISLAKGHYAEAKDKMSAGAYEKLGIALKEDGNEILAQESSDLWIVEKISRKEGQARARDIEDPDLQKATMTEWNKAFSANEIAVAEGQLEMFEGYSPQIENGDIAYLDIPRLERDAMTTAQRGTLRKLEAERITGVPTNSNMDVVQELDDLIAEDKLLAARKYLSKNRDKLKESDRTRYSKGVAEGKKDPEIESYFTVKQRLDQKTSGMGLSDARRFNLEVELDTWSKSWQRRHDGKDPDDDQVDDAIDGLLVGHETLDDYIPFNESIVFEEGGAQVLIDADIKEEAAARKATWNGIVAGYIQRHGRAKYEQNAEALQQAARDEGLIK